MREGELPLPDASDITGDGKPDLFRMADGTWRLDSDGSSYTLDASNFPVVDQTKMLAEQQVNINGLVDNGGVWDWNNARIISADGSTEWKFVDADPDTGSLGHWVESDLLSPIERSVHDVSPDVTIAEGQGKWHAGENYINSIASSDTNLAKGTGANTIASDAVKDVLESHNVQTVHNADGTYHVNIDPSYNQEIGGKIQTTVDKINGWFTPDMDDAKKNEILAEMSKRNLIEVKNLTVEGLDALSTLAKALKGGG